MNPPDNSEPQPFSQELPIGSIAFDRFKILSELGSGGRGRVYKAQDTLLDKTVALKILLSGNNEKYILRFQSEARTISKMHHPNIAMIYDFGMFENTPFLSMEYIEGETLEALLARVKTIALPEFFDIFIDICSALEHAHAAGVVHRDIKPGNIVISSQDDGNVLVKILDFGVAKNLEIIEEDKNSLTPTGNIVGSPSYMSPEQCDGHNVLTIASDSYSLGCVMWECLTGEPPLRGSSVMETLSMHVHQAPEKLAEVVDVPEKLSELIGSLLSKDPASRPDLKTVVTPGLEELRSECAQLFEDSDTVSGAEGDEPLEKQKTYKAFIVPSILILLGIGAVLGGIGAILGTPETESSKDYSRAIKKRMIVKIEEPESVNMDNKILDVRRGQSELNLMAELYSHESLEKCRKLPGLRKLALDDSKITDEQIPILADIPNLETLKLNRTDVHTLRGIEGVKNLCQLELRETKIDDASLKNLVPLKKLNRIYFTRDAITDNGLALLATLPDLREIDVAHTPIKLDPSKVKEFPKLEVLNLDSTDVQEAGLRKLLRSPNLNFVILNRTKFFNNQPLRNDFPTVKFDSEDAVLEIMEQQYTQIMGVSDTKLGLAKVLEMIDLAKKRFGADSPRVTTYLPRLAELYANLDKIGESKRTVAKLLSVYKRTNESSALEGALNAQALLAAKTGDYKTAIALREKLVRVCEQKHGADSAITVTQLVNLGDTYGASRQYKNGLKYFQLAVERSKKLDPDLEAREYALVKCGDCYVLLFDYEHGIECYDQAIAILEHKDINQRQALELLGMYANYASIKLAGGKRAKALEVNEKMLKLIDSGKIPVEDQAAVYVLRSKIFTALGKADASNKAMEAAQRIQAHVQALKH